MAMGLEAMELIMGWEEAFGIQLDDDEAELLKNPRMVIERFSERLGAMRGVDAVCPSHSAFNQVRQAMQLTLGVPRSEIQSRTILRKILPKENRKELWQAICDQVATPTTPPLTWATGIFHGPSSVQGLADWLAFKHPRHFMEAGAPWTHSQVRAIVRAVIRYHSGDYEFSDEDNWAHLP
jgi:hypothetical protein